MTMFSIMESAFPIIFFIIFGIIIVVFIASIGQGISRYRRNEASPKLTVEASVVAKRTEVSHSHHTQGDGVMHDTSHTRYYVTFEVESGDRIELGVKGNEYGMLAEGDRGRLTFQGKRYLGFERHL